MTAILSTVSHSTTASILVTALMEDEQQDYHEKNQSGHEIPAWRVSRTSSRFCSLVLRGSERVWSRGTYVRGAKRAVAFWQKEGGRVEGNKNERCSRYLQEVPTFPSLSA